MAVIEVGSYRVGTDAPCFIIAEAGVNHNGDLKLAKKLIDAARKAGANAVKFQTFRAEKLVSTSAPKAAYQQRTTDAAESQLAMIKALELSEEAHRELLEYCQQQGILFLSSPFDESTADFLEQLGVPAFKVPSGEITNLPFLNHLARKGKPIILSTGMSTIGEVEAAVQVIQAAGNPEIALLHCVSNYPAAAKDINLRAMQTMQQAFSLPVGYSDHVPENEIAFAAVAMGACVVEKHFTLDRKLPGPDHQASSEPKELANLVRGIRNVEAALGDGRKRPAASELDTANVARKSLVAAREIQPGEIIDSQMLAVKRPGTGLQPVFLPQLIGRKARVKIECDSLIVLEDLL